MAHITNKPGVASSMMGMTHGMKGMGSEMMKMSPEMMKNMMGPDMMKGMMGSGMGNQAARETARIVVVTAGPQVRNSIIGRLTRNPLVLIGLGFAAGYLIHKYRKDIISRAKTD